MAGAHAANANDPKSNLVQRLSPSGKPSRQLYRIIRFWQTFPESYLKVERQRFAFLFLGATEENCLGPPTSTKDR
jgi:hypothetical protein